MKMFLSALTALLLAGTTWAADDKPAIKYFDSGFEANTFFAAKTDNLASANYGAGLGLAYFLTENWGAGVEVSGEDVEGLLVEAFEARLMYRVPIKRAAINFGAGYIRDLRGDDRDGFTIFTGPEYAITKRIRAYVEIGMVQFITDRETQESPSAIAKVGAKIDF